jgi:hypothetical protein
MLQMSKVVRSLTIAAVLIGAIAGGARAQTDRMSPADVRVTLNGLFAEHLWLATSATGAALRGDEDGFQAAAGALDANSVVIADAVGSFHGAGARDAFLALWRRHIGFVVDYATGVATLDQRKQDGAVDALMGYVRDLSAVLSSAHPSLPQDAVAGLVREHVVTLKAVIDAQASGDVVRAYEARRAAVAHMRMIADPLASALVERFPDRFRM